MQMLLLKDTTYREVHQHQYKRWYPSAPFTKKRLRLDLFGSFFLLHFGPRDKQSEQILVASYFSPHVVININWVQFKGWAFKNLNTLGRVVGACHFSKRFHRQTWRVPGDITMKQFQGWNGHSICSCYIHLYLFLGVTFKAATAAISQESNLFFWKHQISR